MGNYELNFSVGLYFSVAVRDDEGQQIKENNVCIRGYFGSFAEALAYAQAALLGIKVLRIYYTAEIKEIKLTGELNSQEKPHVIGEPLIHLPKSERLS